MAAGMVFPPLYCPDNTTEVRRVPIHCTPHYSSFTEFVRDMHSENTQKLRDYIAEIYAIFDNTSYVPSRLVKRGMIDALGDVIGYVTGLVSSAELKKVQSTLTKLILDSSSTNRYLTNQIQDLSSIYQVTNKRVDHAIAMITEQNEIFHAFSLSVDKSLETLIKFTQTVFQKLHSVHKMNTAMSEFLHSLQRLATGFLDPAIITPQSLDKVLNDIDKHLQNNFPFLNLVTKAKSFYYSTRSCTTVRLADKLIIFLHIPLTNWRQNFNIYQVETLSVPVPGYSHATRLVGLPKYLIISEDEKHYFESDQMPDFQNNLLRINFQTINSNKNSCIVAILKDSPIHISKSCKFDFLKDGLIPQVLQLTPDSIALIKISNYSLILPNGTKRNYKGCDRFCIKTIPCASMFISSDFVLPALMTTCDNLTHEDQVLYPTNLAILFSFFNSSQLSDFNSNLLLSEELSIQLPKIEFANEKLESNLEADQLYKIDLEKLSKQLERDQTLFDSQLTALNHQIMNSLNTIYTFDCTNWKDWMLTISTGILVILIIVTIVLSQKIYMLNSAIAVATLPVADAIKASFTLSPLIHPKLVSSVSPSISENAPSIFDFQIDIFVQSKLFQTVLLMIIVILLIFIAIQTYNPKSYVIFERKTTMAFNIANAFNMVTLMLPPLPDDITTFKFEGENDIKNIRVIWGIRPKLSMEWDITIRYQWSPKPIEFKALIPLSWQQAFKLKNIIKTQFYVVPYLLDGKGQTSSLSVEACSVPRRPTKSEFASTERIEMVEFNTASTTCLCAKEITP